MLLVLVFFATFAFYESEFFAGLSPQRVLRGVLNM